MTFNSRLGQEFNKLVGVHFKQGETPIKGTVIHSGSDFLEIKVSSYNVLIPHSAILYVEPKEQ